LILTDALSSSYERRKRKKKKKRNSQGFFPQGRHALLAVPHQDFPGCLVHLKAV
jgi:hypothetical protein